MSSLEEQLDVDIKRFFEQVEKQSDNDKVQTLKNLFDKYIHLSKSNYLMNHHDLISIINGAGSIFSNKEFPLFIGDKKRKVLPSEQANLCVIESVINHLNNKDCLKKLPKFDYKEDLY